MRFSQESFYALDAMIALARHDTGEAVRLDELARSGQFPPNFLAKILQKLARGGLVTPHRGRRRGYTLALPPEQITVKDIVETVEGAECFRHCFFRSRRCLGGGPCVLHDIGLAIRSELVTRLRTLTLADATRKTTGVTAC
jgi:Rrf2 family protein